MMRVTICIDYDPSNLDYAEIIGQIKSEVDKLNAERGGIVNFDSDVERVKD